MGFSWNVWPWPWASPVHMQQLRQRNYWEDNYRKVRRTLNAQEVFAASLYDENRALKEQVVAAAERSRRQEELLLGARTHASRQEKQYQQQVNRLYARMHTLQSGPARLTDESVRDQMGRLCFELDTWVKLNFRDTDDLEPIAEGEELHSTSPQRCSWLQAYVLNFVQVLIFAPRRFGLNDDEPFGHCVAEIEDSVHQTNSQAAFHNWKLATGSAIEELTKEQQNGTLAHIIQHIETEFRPATPQRSNSRRQQLRTFLENCVALKNTLARQPDNFTFFRSPAGAEFSAGAMTSFDGRERGTVRHSLWPALVKHDGATPYVIIHAELVWMTD